MKVIFNDTLAGVDFVFIVGREYELDDEEKAQKWVRAGLCRPVTASADPVKKTGDAKPKGETADAKPARKTRGV